MSFNEWKKYSLSDVAEIKYGKDHKHLGIGSIPVYGSGGVMRYADTALYDKESILIPRKGTLGNLFYIDIPFWSVDTIFYTKIKENVNAKFLFYLLKTLNLASMNVGSAVPSLTTEILNKVEITLPPLKTQQRIASILSSLDDKIELNRQTNQTLEAMAQTLFKEMCFPLRDEIPDRWKIGRFKDVATQVKENIKPSKFSQKLFHHYSLPAFDNGEVPSYDLSETILSNKTAVRKYSVLFSKLNPRIPRIWSIGDVDELVSICSTEFIGFVPKKDFQYSYINFFLKDNDTIKKLASHATGTSNSHQRIKPEGILNLELIIPTEKILKDFDEIVRPFLEMRFKNIQQNQTLVAIRNTLLPKLMNQDFNIEAL